jgi:hypothetical protein
MINFLLIFSISEILKSIIINNYYVRKIFFQIIKKSKNKIEIFNWLLNFFFFLTMFFYIFIFIVCLLITFFFKQYLILFLIPFLILSGFFLITLKFFDKKRYILIKISTYIFYISLYIIEFSFNSLNLNLSGFYLINTLEILIIYYLLKNKLNFKINLENLKDFRNLVFLKRIFKLSVKNQLAKISTFLILIFLFIQNNN